MTSDSETLETGDSMYFDATMGHAIVRGSDKPAKTISVISRNAPGPAPKGKD